MRRTKKAAKKELLHEQQCTAIAKGKKLESNSKSVLHNPDMWAKGTVDDHIAQSGLKQKGLHQKVLHSQYVHALVRCKKAKKTVLFQK